MFVEETEKDADKEGGVETITTFDSVEVNWTQDALKKLEEFPAGHIRRKAQARVEKNARVQNTPTITVAFFDKVLNEKTTAKGESTVGNGKGNGNGNGDKVDVGLGEVDESKYTWSPEATQRLERVPQGFMRDNTKNRVLNYAESINATDITLEVCEKGIEESVKLMAQAVENGATIEDFLPQKDNA